MCANLSVLKSESKKRKVIFEKSMSTDLSPREKIHRRINKIYEAQELKYKLLRRAISRNNRKEISGLQDHLNTLELQLRAQRSLLVLYWKLQ